MLAANSITSNLRSGGRGATADSTWARFKVGSSVKRKNTMERKGMTPAVTVTTMKLVKAEKDILTIEPREILDTEVLYTVIGGEVVYEMPTDDAVSAN